MESFTHGKYYILKNIWWKNIIPCECSDRPKWVTRVIANFIEFLTLPKVWKTRASACKAIFIVINSVTHIDNENI